jgi:hypothetical protein
VPLTTERNGDKLNVLCHTSHIKTRYQKHWNRWIEGSWLEGETDRQIKKWDTAKEKRIGQERMKDIPHGIKRSTF